MLVGKSIRQAEVSHQQAVVKRPRHQVERGFHVGEMNLACGFALVQECSCFVPSLLEEPVHQAIPKAGIRLGGTDELAAPDSSSGDRAWFWRCPCGRSRLPW